MCSLVVSGPLLQQATRWRWGWRWFFHSFALQEEASVLSSGCRFLNSICSACLNYFVNSESEEESCLKWGEKSAFSSYDQCVREWVNESSVNSIVTDIISILKAGVFTVMAYGFLFHAICIVECCVWLICVCVCVCVQPAIMPCGHYNSAK